MTEDTPLPGLQNPRIHAPLIALMTDFGTGAWHVGAMKAVIKSLCPTAEILDISHGIEPFSVVEGAYVLSACWKSFPAWTIFCAVVDPGVGTAREPVIIRAIDRWFIGPNNGLFGFLSDVAEVECRKLAKPEYFLAPLSATFHGRDIFAPCAAHLGMGVDWRLMGPEKSALVPSPWPAPVVSDNAIEGCVIHFDRFGNAVTSITHNLDGAGFANGSSVSLPDGRAIALTKTYGDVPAQMAVAYWGSSGHLEIAVNLGAARDALGLKLFDKIILRSSKRAANGGT